MIQLFFFLLVTLVLTTCSTAPPKLPGQRFDVLKWQQHQQEIHRLSRYQTRGTFIYLSEQKKIYARFFLEKSGPDNYQLLLLNPLGSTEFKLNAKPGQIQIIDKMGQCYTAINTEEMIGKLIGIPISLNRLNQWILGLPDDTTEYKFDNQYRLKELNYSDNGKNWKVVYTGYNTKIIPALPSSVELIEKDQCIKIKIDNWILK